MDYYLINHYVKDIINNISIFFLLPNYVIKTISAISFNNLLHKSYQII